MSISEKNKNKLVEYLVGKGHTILDNATNVKVQTWTIQCRDCGHENSIRVNNLTPLLNTSDDICCKSCKFNQKLNKFLDRCNLTLGEDSRVHCKKCNLCYGYQGDYQDRFKCYCAMSIKQTEHQLYKELTYLFSSHDAILSKEARTFGTHKVDIQVVVGHKTFWIEVDDHGHFNPNNTQGRSDIASIMDFLELDREDTYLVHITEDDVYKIDSIRTLALWMTKHL